jgi:7,8-dihydropterin-6-yl-methyl-4-(beta-D-ribofuranosyl)aminobenzene 5'-phosphate synthase
MDDLPHLNLQEVDSLEATVIIDNELDPMSPAAPDTVRIAGQMGNIIFKPGNEITNRGDASRELRMGDICCAAHGLSILVVRRHTMS